MDKNLLQKAKAPMIALIQTKNIMRNNNLKTKTKRAFALLLLAILAPVAARAQNYGGGSGLMDDPYIISTTSHWLQLANQVGNGNDYQWKYFLLVEDLDFSSTTFQPIGRNFSGSEKCFKGTFNGDGHTISNVTFYGNDVTAGQCVGLFGMVKGGKIRNLTLAGNSSIIGCNNVGGIVGSLDEGGEVDYCHVDQGVTIGPANIAIQMFGGIVGLCKGGSSISNCTSRATVTNNQWSYKHCHNWRRRRFNFRQFFHHELHQLWYCERY